STPPVAPPPPPAAFTLPATPKIVVTAPGSHATPAAGAPPSPAAPQSPRSGANDLERVAEDLLRASSALGSLPRRATPEPAAPEPRSMPRDVRSPIPMAIAGLALEVEALGVPEGHRARARAVLLDLSRRLEAPTLSWESLREAMSFVMEFPALGRRMIPLLLPYFDRAA